MSIVLERLVHRYGEHTVVNTVSLEVGDGELFVLLGPSGSGKSTVLRMIAGLVEIEQGSVRLHGRDVTRLPPQKRGVGLVFQHYALFRHMTAAENIEFALRIRRVPREERQKRRDELLDLVGLVGLGGRMPRQLSGGQQQRVALARALAHRPEVLLLDEPFGALDARIRSELRRTVRAIQRELGIATIFVTHDQEEAFEIADRMGVMNFGRLLEVGPPRELYLRPQTEFVATFLGTANLLVGRYTPTGVRLGEVEFPLSTGKEGAADGVRVQVLFRPEDVAVKTSPGALSWPLLGEAEVEETLFAGSFERLRLRLPPIEGVRSIAPPAPYGGESVVIRRLRKLLWLARLSWCAGQGAVIRIGRRLRGAPPRVLRGTYPMHMVPSSVKIDRLAGFPSRSVVVHTKLASYKLVASEDFDLVLSDAGYAWDEIHWAAACSIVRDADVWITYFDSDFGSRLQPGTTGRFLALFKRLGVRIVVSSNGLDSAHLAAPRSRYGWVEALGKDYPSWDIAAETPATVERLKVFATHADFVIGHDYPTSAQLPRKDIVWNNFTVDLEGLAPKVTTGRDVPVVVHAPNHRHYKATEVLLEALERVNQVARVGRPGQANVGRDNNRVAVPAQQGRQPAICAVVIEIQIHDPGL